MWAILNTLSGTQEVEEVVIDNSANWTPLRIGSGGMLGSNNPVESSANTGSNPMNPNGPSSVPAIKVSD